jgi:hypothetical protein
MNFDPIEYLMKAESRRRDADAHHAVTIARMMNALGSHEKRIGSLERWKQSTMRTVRKWPYIVIPITIVAANIAPTETIKIVVDLVKAVL